VKEKWAKMLELLPFRRTDTAESAAAIERAEQSCVTARADLDQASQLRAEAEEAAAEVRAHNRANMFDDFLQRVMQGRA
jgi:flavin-dependent dehydrogenase